MAGTGHGPESVTTVWSVLRGAPKATTEIKGAADTFIIPPLWQAVREGVQRSGQCHARQIQRVVTSKDAILPMKLDVLDLATPKLVLKIVEGELNGQGVDQEVVMIVWTEVK
ncbi:MAG: hypothetical protein Q9183_001008 [Haloplaca sp. 2 TL-2023]